MAKIVLERLVDRSSMPAWARVLLVLLAFLFVGGFFQLVGALAVGMPIIDMPTLRDVNLEKHMVVQLFGFIGAALVVYFFWSQIDKQPIVSLGFSTKGILADLLLGLLVAVVVIAGGTLILMAMGAFTISGYSFNSASLFYSFLLFIFVSLTEEILVRGYILNTLMIRYNRYVALIVSSVIFALMHGANSSISWLPMLNLFLAGVILGSVFIYTRNLWFPISLHLFWNFLQGPVLGYSVSGNPINSIVSHSVEGSSTLTGGPFGFEGSIVCTVLVSLLIAILMWAYSNKEKKQLALQASEGGNAE